MAPLLVRVFLCEDVERDIVLKRGYVLVYPDPMNKPAVGEGLNKAATVTMYQCFPPGDLIQDENAAQELGKFARCVGAA